MGDEDALSNSRVAALITACVAELTDPTPETQPGAIEDGSDGASPAPMAASVAGTADCLDDYLLPAESLSPAGDCADHQGDGDTIIPAPPTARRKALLREVRGLLRRQELRAVRCAARGQVCPDAAARWAIVWEPHPSEDGLRVFLPAGDWQPLAEMSVNFSWRPDDSPTAPPYAPWHLSARPGCRAASGELRLRWAGGPVQWDAYFRERVLVLDLMLASRPAPQLCPPFSDVGIVGVLLELVHSATETIGDDPC